MLDVVSVGLAVWTNIFHLSKHSSCKAGGRLSITDNIWFLLNNIKECLSKFSLRLKNLFNIKGRCIYRGPD